MKGKLLATVLMVLWPAVLSAQLGPDLPEGWGNNSPRIRRAKRERAVARLGTDAARSFVETSYGDEAVAAIFRCSVGVGRSLAEFHASGGLDQILKPRELLLAIAQCGDDAALFAVRNAKELEDLDQLNGFLASPLEVALGLKPLEMAGSEYRANRLTPRQLSHAGFDWGAIAALGSFVVLVALFFWRKRHPH